MIPGQEAVGHRIISGPILTQCRSLAPVAQFILPPVNSLSPGHCWNHHHLQITDNCLSHHRSLGTRIHQRFRIFLSSPREAQAPAGRPRGARAFHELRRYHTRPLRLNWGPENVHFGKRHFWDLNINVNIFFVENLKNYQTQLFLWVFH